MQARPFLAVIQDEHVAIRHLVHAIDGIAGALKEGRKVECADARDALDAVAQLSDACHHAKEEDALFPAIMDSRQAAFAKGLVPALEREHQLGKKFVTEMRAHVDGACNGDMRAMTMFAHAAHQYAQLYLGHLRREEHDLLPLAEALPARGKAAVEKAFARIEGRHAPDHHAILHARIEALALKYARYANAAA